MQITVIDLSKGKAPETPPQAVARMARDIAAAGATLSGGEAAYLVDAYYRMQNARIRVGNQTLAASKDREPHALLSWFHGQNRVLEEQIKRALDKYTLSTVAGAWARAQMGIGPVLCAGIVGAIDITKAPTAGHIWAFFGFDPTKAWLKGQKCPWSPKAKVLGWKAGQRFMKNSNREECYYGQVYRQRKEYEWDRNCSGLLAQQATAQALRYGADTDAKAWAQGRLDGDTIRALRAAGPLVQAEVKKLRGEVGAGTPMLPPAHIDARARRYAVKLFLAHLHDVMYRDFYDKEPPLPYPIAHLQHAHYIAPPPGGEPAQADDDEIDEDQIED